MSFSVSNRLTTCRDRELLWSGIVKRDWELVSVGGGWAAGMTMASDARGRPFVEEGGCLGLG